MNITCLDGVSTFSRARIQRSEGYGYGSTLLANLSSPQKEIRLELDVKYCAWVRRWVASGTLSPHSHTFVESVYFIHRKENL